MTVAWDGTLDGYQDSAVLASVVSGFWRVDAQGELLPQSTFGTVTKVSNRPLTVRYTLNPRAVWSDGQAIDCDDLLLGWARSPLASQTRRPTCAPTARTLTVVHNTPTSDWRGLLAQPLLPAHQALKQAGVGKAAFIAAVRSGTTATVRRVTAVVDQRSWGDTSTLSSGPYLVDSWTARQTLILKANPRWWGTPARTAEVAFRYVEPNEMPQALLNGEVDVVAPPAELPIVNALTDQGSETTIHRSGSLRYEHVRFNPSSLFRDATLRRAFTMCLPQSTLVESLVTPLDSNAEVLHARLTMPYQPTYRAVVRGTRAGDFERTDPSAARDLVTARKATGRTVRIAYRAGDARRASEVAQIKAACDQAGFNVQDAAVNDLASAVRGGRYDALLEEVTLSPLPGARASTIQNPSTRVRALVTQLRSQPETAAQNQLIADLERQLWLELPTVPLYAYPSLAASRGIDGVSPTVQPAGLTWNLAEWERN